MSSMTYDDALQAMIDTLLKVLTVDVERVVVARDLKGQLRLCVSFAFSTLQFQADAWLSNATDGLDAQLGGWFAKPILCASAKDNAERLAAQTVLDLAKNEGWPEGWPRTGTAPITATVDARWSGLRPSIAKASWMRARGTSPDEAERKTESAAPKIVSFHSFKGGVGRTTSAGLFAHHAIKDGKKVVVVDLDLEAPGLHRVCGVEMDGPGVLDYILEFQATRKIRSVEPVPVPGTDGKLLCLHAGKYSPTYVERLGHLDFATSLEGEAQLVSKALQKILLMLRKQKPDLVFLDARAGLHDLGGIALRDLASVHVLVVRGNRQGEDGLRRTFELLTTRDPDTQPAVMILQNFVPAEFEARKRAESTFRATALRIVEEVGWYAEDASRGLDDPEAPHYPQTVPVLAGGTIDESLDLILEDDSISKAYGPAWSRLKVVLEAEEFSELAK